MSKGIKRVLVIAVVAVALIAITTSVAFAWWDSTKSTIDITTSNTASNVTLTVTKDSITNNVKLVPANAFTDATHATSICIGAFTPTVTSNGVAQDAIDKVDLKYSISEFTLDIADQKNTNKFVITVNTSQTDTTGAIQADSGKLTSGTKYYIHIAFASDIKSADAKTFDSNAIQLKIVVTASDKATA